jgi:hypothetical protein
MPNYYIWIEAEQWVPAEWNPKDCNSDVIVSFEKNGEWVATFFTYDNVRTLAKRNQDSGDCLSGSYFWASDMILVDVLTRERVEEVVAHLISESEFEKVFSQGPDI